MALKKVIVALLAILIALFMGIYQRVTGPTYPQKISIRVDQISIQGELPRSGITGKDQPIELYVNGDITNKKFSLLYRRYQFDSTWTEIPMMIKGNKIIGKLPTQPPAGKLEYGIAKITPQGEHKFISPSSTVIRFKGAVPTLVLVIHILFIFTFMIFSNYVALHTLVLKMVPDKSLILTLLFLILGGLIMGPIVQKYAFGAFWTGFPFGYDLTDNKVLIAFIFWILGFVRYKKNQDIKFIYIAAVITFIIFVIPHSALGSTLDYHTMEVIQK